MPFKSNYAVKSKKIGQSVKPSLRRFNALADLRTKRIATQAAYRAINRSAEKKSDFFNTSAWPVAPGGSAVATVNVAGGTQFGSVYQATAGLTPLVFEMTRSHTGGTGQTDIIGNKVLYDSMKIKLFCQPLENQSTFDQVSFRFSVLQLRQGSFLPTSTANSTTFTRNLYQYGMSSGSGTNVSVSQFSTTPWDLTKVKVLADEVKYVHATPTTVTAQANCHFKTVAFDWEKIWPKGLPIQYDSSIDFSTNTQTINPIICIVQCMEPVVTGPATQTMTFALTTDSFCCAAWRDM